MEKEITAFVARDENGDLYLYNTDCEDDIYKEKTMWRTLLDVDGYRRIPNNLCPDVKWEDEEPTEVEITIKRK